MLSFARVLLGDIISRLALPFLENSTCEVTQHENIEIIDLQLNGKIEARFTLRIISALNFIRLVSPRFYKRTTSQINKIYNYKGTNGAIRVLNLKQGGACLVSFCTLPLYLYKIEKEDPDLADFLSNAYWGSMIVSAATQLRIRKRGINILKNRTRVSEICNIERKRFARKLDSEHMVDLIKKGDKEMITQLFDRNEKLKKMLRELLVG